MTSKYLYRELCRLATLRAAWDRVEQSDGCAGIDSVTIARFGANLDTELIRSAISWSKAYTNLCRCCAS